jgi:hypothetical protein
MTAPAREADAIMRIPRTCTCTWCWSPKQGQWTRTRTEETCPWHRPTGISRCGKQYRTFDAAILAAEKQDQQRSEAARALEFVFPRRPSVPELRGRLE